MILQSYFDKIRQSYWGTSTIIAHHLTHFFSIFPKILDVLGLHHESICEFL